MIAAGTLPPHRVALLSPGPRDEWYSASALYSRALYVDVIPGLREAVPVEGLPVGMGASLGALAMLVTQRRAPGTFGALFLQSGSFFMPRFDSQESGFPRYGRIVRVVRRILRSRAHPDPVPVQLTCGTAEENVFNNRVMARALAEQGYDARLDEVPDMHNYTGWRDAFDPHLTRAACEDLGDEARRAVLARHRRGRQRLRLRPLRPPRPRLPGRGRQRGGLGQPGDGARGGRAARGRPLQALLRRRVRLRRPRRLRGMGHRPGGAVHPRRPRRPAGHRHHRDQHGRVPRRQLRAPAGGSVHRRPLHVGQLRVRPHRRGRRLPRRPPRLDPLARQLPAGVRAGHVGGHDRRAREHETPRLAAGREGHPRTSSTCGGTTSRTTGRHGARRSRIICPGSADGRHATPDRTAARDRGGLAARVRDAAGPARARQGRLRHHPSRRRRADHDRAVRPARQAALRPRRRPPRLLVLRPARVAEEGLADGRRVPAQQPVHVPGDGEARGLLRDAAARSQGAPDRARAAQGAAGQRAVRLHGGASTTCRSTSSRSPSRSATRCS